MLSRKCYLTKIYPIGFTVIISFSILARTMWAGRDPYNDFWHTLSGLYQPLHPESNPVGAFFFWASMLVLGVLVLLMTMYVHPRLVKAHKVFAFCGTVLMVVGGFGFFLVGLFPRRSLDFIRTNIHEYCAVAGVIGVACGAGLYSLAILRGRVPVNRTLHAGIGGLASALAIVILASLLGAYGGINPDWSEEDPIPGVSPFFSIALCEKVAFLSFLVYLGLIGVLIPDRIRPSYGSGRISQRSTDWLH